MFNVQSLELDTLASFFSSRGVAKPPGILDQALLVARSDSVRLGIEKDEGIARWRSLGRFLAEVRRGSRRGAQRGILKMG